MLEVEVLSLGLSIIATLTMFLMRWVISFLAQDVEKLKKELNELIALKNENIPKKEI